jgi:hypothetical protein
MWLCGWWFGSRKLLRILDNIFQLQRIFFTCIYLYSCTYVITSRHYDWIKALIWSKCCYCSSFCWLEQRDLLWWPSVQSSKCDSPQSINKKWHFSNLMSTFHISIVKYSSQSNRLIRIWLFRCCKLWMIDGKEKGAAYSVQLLCDANNINPFVHSISKHATSYTPANAFVQTLMWVLTFLSSTSCVL